MHKFATLCALPMTGGAAFAQDGEPDIAMPLPRQIKIDTVYDGPAPAP